MHYFEASPKTIILRILWFHNCEECVRKVGIALHQIDGVELVGFDPVTGNLTVSTAKHPEVIKDAIERKTKKKVMILSEEIIPRNPNQILNSTLPLQGTVNVQELAEALIRVSRVEGLNNVELFGDLNSNSFRLSFSHRYGNVVIEDGGGESNFFPPPPRTAVDPSESMAETSDRVQVYGYPPEYYGFGTTCDHHHPKKCCTIL